MRFHQVMAQVLKNGSQSQQVGRLVIDQQDVHPML